VEFFIDELDHVCYASIIVVVLLLSYVLCILLIVRLGWFYVGLSFGDSV